MIIFRITMDVLPEKQKEVMQTLLSMIETAKKEKGCLSYEVFLHMEKNGFQSHSRSGKTVKTWNVISGLKDSAFCSGQRAFWPNLWK
jgi:hypothetical protein